MKLFDYTGVIHLHSSFSFDGHVPPEEILRAANKHNIDFLMLTDHDCLAARSDGWEGWNNNTLLIVGQEISPRFNHYLAFNTNEPISTDDDPEGKKPQKYINAVNDQGGCGFIAHPDHEGAKMFHVKHYPWNDWTVNGYKGMSVWDFMTDWQSSLRGYFISILNFMFPAWFLRGPHVATLQRWDKLNQEKKIIGFGELDNHATKKRVLGITFVAFPFDRAFKFIRTHVLTNKPLCKDKQKDIENIINALVHGRAYFTLEYFHKASGFNFFIKQKGLSYQMGDSLKLKDARLHVLLPAKAFVRVIRNGSLWTKDIASEFSRQISEPGIYRVEILRKAYGKLRPWIFSNPIFVC